MTTAPRKNIGRFYELQQEVKIPEDYILTENIRISPPTRRQMIQARQQKTDEDFHEHYIGDAYGAVCELYADRPEQEYQAFLRDLFEHFIGKGADDEGKSEGSSS